MLEQQAVGRKPQRQPQLLGSARSLRSEARRTHHAFGRQPLARLWHKRFDPPGDFGFFDLDAQLLDCFGKTGGAQQVPDEGGNGHLLLGCGDAEEFVETRRKLYLDLDVAVVVDEGRPRRAGLNVDQPSVPAENYAVIVFQHLEARIGVDADRIARLVDRAEARRQPSVAKRHGAKELTVLRIADLHTHGVQTMRPVVV